MKPKLFNYKLIKSNLIYQELFNKTLNLSEMATFYTLQYY